MAAKPKTTKRARDLDEKKRTAARRAYLFDEMEIGQIARLFSVSVAYLLRLSSDENWQGQAERLGRDPTYLREREKQAEELSRAKVTIERLHAKTAIKRARAQHAIAERLAEEAAAAETEKQVHEIARTLGPASADIQSGRLSVGLTTDKTEVQESQEAYQATLDRMVAAGLLKADDAPTTDARPVPGVEPGQGMDTAPGATPRT